MRTRVLTGCAVVLISVLACSQDGGGNLNDNMANDNSSTSSGGVSFPEDDSALVTIEDEGGISAKLLGETNTPGSSAMISGFSGDTGSEEFSADFDDTLRTERVGIGETEVMFDYADDDTFSFDVNRGGETVFSGSELAVPRPNGRVAQQVGPEDLDACSDALIQSLAFVIEQEMTGDPSAFPDQATIDCLTGVQELEALSTLTCVSTLVFIPALIEALLQCQLFDDPIACLDRATPAVEALGYFTEILNVVLEDVVRQIRMDPDLCL